MHEKTRITTFGYNNGDPPSADTVFDVRQETTGDTPEGEREAADRILKRVKPGDRIAIGCDHGQFSSVHVARLVKKALGDNCTITHRDLEGEYNMAPLKQRKGIIGENIRTLKHKGLSETEATKKALAKDHATMKDDA